MKLSIIIPIYNVEKYVAKCLQSCLNQDIPSTEYEIIVINDGTLDNSMKIVRDIAKQYNNIVIIEQENQGLSVARNNGLQEANGEYVWFIDSDDWIEGNCLKRITSQLTGDLDVLQLQYRLAYDDSNKNKDCLTIVNGRTTGPEQMTNGGLPAPAQFAIYRTKFLKSNELTFVKGIYHEDSEIKPKIVYSARQIASDNIVCYNYYQRTSGSITSKFSLKRAKDLLFICNRLYEYSIKLPKNIQACFNDHISLNFNTLADGFHSLTQKEKREIKILIKDNNHLFDCMKNSRFMKYRLEGFFFKTNISLGIVFYKLYQAIK